MSRIPSRVGTFYFAAYSFSLSSPLDGFVRFISKGDGDDICDELDIDLTFPGEEHYSNEETEPGPVVAEGSAAAAA